MYKYITSSILPYTLCLGLLSGGLCLTPAVSQAQDNQDALMSGKLYAERDNDNYREHNKQYRDDKRYKKNDSSRLHDNRNHDRKYDGRRDDDRSYDGRRDRDHKYDGRRDNDRNRSYDGRRDRDHKYDGRRDNDRSYDGRRDNDRSYDGRRDGMRDTQNRSHPANTGREEAPRDRQP